MHDQVIGGRYHLIERIGEGGMAFVYLARDEKLDRLVAIKVLHEHLAANPEIRDRFQLEARAVSAVDHPNIVKIFDFSGADSDCLWLVTEILNGANLAQFMRTFASGQVPFVLAGFIVRETCKALSKAHENSIVHRDIKPENVMVSETGEIKLMDFGIAKKLQREAITKTGTFMGSPSYMSPEQVRGQHVDHRSDIYSLGVLFYEVITGQLPFVGSNTHEVILKIVEAPVVAPMTLMPTLPPEIDAMIRRCLEKDPAKRFQNISELGSALDHFFGFYGFMESHVELQRYFADRASYERRLVDFVPTMSNGTNASFQTPIAQYTPQPQVPAQSSFAGAAQEPSRGSNPKAPSASIPRGAPTASNGRTKTGILLPRSTQWGIGNPAVTRPGQTGRGIVYRGPSFTTGSKRHPYRWIVLLLLLAALVAGAYWGSPDVQKRVEEWDVKKLGKSIRPFLTLPAAKSRIDNRSSEPSNPE